MEGILAWEKRGNADNWKACTNPSDYCLHTAEYFHRFTEAGVGADEEKKKKKSRVGDSTTVADEVPFRKLPGFRMKIDVGHSALLKSRTEITIQSDYPCPLIAADSMSQSGMCIINQWLLSAPPSSRSSYPFSSGLFSM